MNELIHNLLPFIIAGFMAQLIDGSLGMGYKVSSTTFLLASGLQPALASSSVHTAGMFTSAASGLAHFKFGNLDKKLFKQLVIPGITGGILGVMLLNLVPGDVLKPFVAFYLLLMGVRIVVKSLNRIAGVSVNANVGRLGFVGGFFDAVGGGGWGPIVTGTLVANGHDPRLVIGSTNIAEFFVTVAQVVTFFVVLRGIDWTVVGGLVIGGVAAAPLAAWVCRRLPLKKLMLAVGVLIILLSLRTLLDTLL